MSSVRNSNKPPSRVVSLPDDVLVMVFRELQAMRKNGKQHSVDRTNLARKKLSPIFVRTSLVSARFNRLSQPFLYSEITATEMGDARLGLCFQTSFKSPLARRIAKLPPAHYVQSVSLYWTLLDQGMFEYGDDDQERTQGFYLDISRSRAKIFQTMANLSPCRNLVRLTIVIRIDHFLSSEHDYQLLPSLADFTNLPFLSNLKYLSIENGSDKGVDDELSPISKDDVGILLDFLRQLPNLRRLSLAGYDLSDLSLPSATKEKIGAPTPWPHFRQLEINSYRHEAQSITNSSYAFLIGATSKTLRILSISTQLASARLAPILDQFFFPHLEVLSLREGQPTQDDFGEAIVSYDWSTFFLSIPKCVELNIDFSTRHTQSSFDSFLSDLHASKNARLNIQKISLAIRSTFEQIDPILALDALALLLPLTAFAKLEQFEFAILEPNEEFMNMQAEQFMLDNPALSTLSHLLIYKILVLVDAAQSKTIDIVFRVTPESEYTNPFVFDTIKFTAKSRDIKISAKKPKKTLVKLLLTTPVTAAINELKRQNYSVRWAI